ncbi:MAG: response regulator transcription factor [Thermoanaerobaculia bacterium]
MSDEDVTVAVPVCLFWLHPLVASEFQRLLPQSQFTLENIRIEPDLVNRISALVKREVSLHVVDTDHRKINTQALVAGILACNPAARLIVVAEQFTESAAIGLLRLGCKGLLSYAEIPERLARALNEVNRGGFWVPRALLSRFVDSTVSSNTPLMPTGGTGKLTPREREIFEDLLENLSNKDIAKKRQISGRTAKFHVSNVLAKYGVKRRADLLLLSLQERESRPVH